MSGAVGSQVEMLCRALDRTSDESEPNRRLVVRKALREAWEAGWQEGYTDGIVDGAYS